MLESNSAVSGWGVMVAGDLRVLRLIPIRLSLPHPPKELKRFAHLLLSVLDLAMNAIMYIRDRPTHI